MRGLRIELPGIDDYFDHVQLWLATPLEPAQIQRLAHLCVGKAVHVSDRPMRFQPSWRQRLQLKQPTVAACRMLEKIGGPVKINHVELARDSAYSGNGYTINDRDDAFEALSGSWVRKWHRKQHGLRFAGEGNVTRYDAPRTASTLTTMYEQDHCRTTGELNCLHLEWRVSTARACRSLGIVTLQDLIDFDHKAFWQAKLEHVYAVDSERLGRLLRNRRRRTRSQSAKVVRWSPNIRVNVDGRTGHVIVSGCGSVQGVVDMLGFATIKHALRRVDVGLG